MTAQLSVTPSELVILLQQKNKAAFSLLYDCYTDAVFGAICRLVKEIPVAEDLLQDTFVKIWRKIDLYDAGRGTLFTWMINIATNTCIDYLRSKQHTQTMRTAKDEYADCEQVSSSFDPNWNIIQAELFHFTQKLEIKYSKIIELVFFLGYTHEEAAQIMAMPVGTVKTRSRAGLKQLRNLYD